MPKKPSRSMTIRLPVQQRTEVRSIGAKGEVVANLTPGSTVEVLERQGSGYRVRLDDGKTS